MLTLIESFLAPRARTQEEMNLSFQGTKVRPNSSISIYPTSSQGVAVQLG